MISRFRSYSNVAALSGIISSSGGSASYSFITTVTQNVGGSTTGIAIFTGLNLGSGSELIILMGNIQNATSLTNVSVNGSNLILQNTSVDQQYFVYSGTCVATGVDTISITAPNSIQFGDANIIVYKASNLISNNVIASNSAGSGTISTAPVSVGNFVFGTVLNDSFTNSPQAPFGTHSVTGVNGGVLFTADWTASSAGLSGSTFNATVVSFADPSLTVWH